MAQKTLERLEWAALLARLGERLATPGARARLAAGESALFEQTRAGVIDRLAETAEARRLLRAGEHAPLDGVADLGAALAHAAKGGVLEPRELRDLGATLRTLRSTRDFLTRRAETAPRLADLASLLPHDAELEREIERCIDPEGELRDDASPALAAARRSIRELSSEVQERI